MAGEEPEQTFTLTTQPQADSPDGVSAGVRMQPALRGLAQDVPQSDLRAIGHLQGLPLGDPSQPTLRSTQQGEWEGGETTQRLLQSCVKSHLNTECLSTVPPRLAVAAKMKSCSSTLQAVNTSRPERLQGLGKVPESLPQKPEQALLQQITLSAYQTITWGSALALFVCSLL